MIRQTGGKMDKKDLIPIDKDIILWFKNLIHGDNSKEYLGQRINEVLRLQMYKEILTLREHRLNKELKNL